ncbi:MAG TPA: outer membrane protein transport protein [Gammaproteobacteria bacterium]|nr:outer membrane protein transport protein [Gammaproteobacteria bacterium]
MLKLKSSFFSLLALCALNAHAAGYKLEFQSPSVLADSGDAAVVEDAGTNWYNSAGLVDLPQQITGSAIDVYESTTFHGTSTAPSPFGAAFSFAGVGKASSYSNSVLPAVHYSLPFLGRYAFGLSVVPAWGLMEDYGPGSVVRYDLDRIYTRTIDIAPSLAARINSQWSIGLGPDFHYFALQQEKFGRTQGPAGLGGTTGDSFARISVNNWNMGGHIGVLYRMDEATRFGLNYRSKITMDLGGYSSFVVNNTAPTFETNQFKVNLILPPTTTFSFYRDINCLWAVMGTVSYDQWSVVRNLHGFNYMLPTATTVNVNLQQDYRNTFDFSLGAHYKLSEQWLLRGSVKYEQTPTNDQFRDLSFPDAEKLGFNIGGRYQMAKKLALDLVYAHVFTRSVPINITLPAALGAVHTNGSVGTGIDLVGAQLVYDI